MMDGYGKSDSPILPKRPPNKASAAEGVEGRGLAKGNLPEHEASRTQSRTGAPSGLERVRQAAVKDRKQRFTALFHHVYQVDLLREAYFSLKRNAAPGIDGETWRQYGERLEENLRDLSLRLRRGAFRVNPVLRVYISKTDGRKRPIGIPVLEDKIVQRAVSRVLDVIYELDFLGFSYGFRPERNPHQALDALLVGILTRKVNWVLDADIRGFLETSSHYTPSHERLSKRAGWATKTLIYKPFRFPQRTWTAGSSPRFTRCNTVWRETPRSLVASSIGTWPSGASATKRARISSLMRMRHGAPGVICSPAMKPSASQRCTVEGTTPRISAALLIVTNSPLEETMAGSNRGICQYRRRLPTLLAVNRSPLAVRLPCRFRIPAMTASG